MQSQLISYPTPTPSLPAPVLSPVTDDILSPSVDLPEFQDVTAGPYPNTMIFDGQLHARRDMVFPDPTQHRKLFDPQLLREKAESIEQDGITTPLLVVPRKEGGFKLVTGERRWRASGLIGLEWVPIRVSAARGKRLRVLQVIENVQRVEIQPIEEATAYQQLVEENNWDAAQVGHAIGKSECYVERRIALLSLHPMLQGLVRREPIQGQLSFSQGYAIVKTCEKTENPRNTQFKVLKAYQRGEDLDAVLRAIRAQVVEASQGLMFSLDMRKTANQTRAKAHRRRLCEMLRKIETTCATMGDASDYQLAARAFRADELDSTVARLQQMQKQLARVERELLAAKVGQKLYRNTRGTR